ncbi:unnamed protein product [Lymnaea stagnalis]|uniref:Spindle and centriole-associated protein 1 n=1 Tax=Lymnaea stagnalis TaxID=6523 RepID=A0AAV2I851_LYMST
MSFYRLGHNRRKKAPSKKRPSWDDTVNDLTVLRATPEEVLMRKEAHKSKNHLSVKLEKLRQEREKSKMSGADAQQLVIMKEVLYDQQQLEKVLAKTDRMMSVVKDLFGDDPKRFLGFPNVTTAPNAEHDSSNCASSFVASVPDIYTQTEKLSDSIMDQSALNDMDSSVYSDSSEDEDRPKPISYESKMDLHRFQEFLKEEEKRTAHMDPPTHQPSGNIRHYQDPPTHQPSGNIRHYQDPPTQQPNRNIRHYQNNGDFGLNTKLKTLAVTDSIAQGQGANKEKERFGTPPRNERRGPPLPSERSPPSAMNDTKKVKKTKSINKTSSICSDSGNTTMNDMRKVLQELETEITLYEQQTGRQPHQVQKTETFSGYTIALVTAVSRLTKYLKEAELRINTEVTLREHLTEDVYQLKIIIDALATDLLTTQEEYGKLYLEHLSYRETTQAQLADITNQLKELRWSRSDNPGLAKTDQEISYNNNNNTHSGTSTPLHNAQDPKEPSSYHLLTGANVKTTEAAAPTSDTGIIETDAPTATAAAILLSPPVRKTRLPTTTQAGKYRQSSLASSSSSTNERSYPSLDPPYLTQAPPMTSTVSVPRPIPLVQTNVCQPLTFQQPMAQASVPHLRASGSSIFSKPQPADDSVGLEDEAKLLQQLSVDEALSNPALQSLMQSQITELNRQQEEARRRLLELLDSNRLQQQNLPHFLEQGFSPIEADKDSYGLEHKEGTHKGRQLNKPRSRSVSPPISPIPFKNENCWVLKTGGNQEQVLQAQ